MQRGVDLRWVQPQLHSSRLICHKPRVLFHRDYIPEIQHKMSTIQFQSLFAIRKFADATKQEKIL